MDDNHLLVEKVVGLFPTTNLDSSGIEPSNRVRKKAGFARGGHVKYHFSPVNQA